MVRRRSTARRIPATDLEAIVEGRITDLFADASTIDTIVAPRARDVEERRRLVARANEMARLWPDLSSVEKITGLQRLVQEIVVTSNAVYITIRVDAILAMLRGEADSQRDDDGETLTLSVPATLKRVGMEMRHLIDAPEARQNRKPDHSLLRLLARAQKFRDLILQGDGASITELAAASAVTPSYFTRIVRLGFLAPEITAAILDGRQPIELSALKLSLASLPKEWSEQRRELGFR
ncbi:hypothetical protein [Xanthobacter oligotrophicus]|uniref:hypothetical protein n=1 Tax=Xanthobacter oligotrophicus TaxID=2607286 RepID=UPI001EE4ED53|nr:hypothetical protein [Xanthobacter oligotrophicus]MCG5234368.1 hypothetical protein [Xanthobacter oligotrophicus]